MLPPLTNQSQQVSARPTFDRKFKLLNFAKHSLKAPVATGAVAPTSRFVVDKVMQLAEVASAKNVVELGPGTGVFTEQIHQLLPADATFFAIELNSTFVEVTRQRCPDVTVYHDAAEALPHYLKKNNLSQSDLIVTSLPWTIFDQEDQHNLLNTISASLKPGGKFMSIVYLGAKSRARGRNFINSLPLHFKSVQKSKTIWQNLPPTQIYCCSN